MSNPPGQVMRRGAAPSLYGGAPYWLIRDGLGAEPARLEEREVCDVLVVGAGVTGALVADRLTRDGMNVAVVDARVPGIGSTAASTAILLYELDVELRALARKIGLDGAVAAYRLSRRGLELVSEAAQSLDENCGYRAGQALYVTGHRWRLGHLRAEAALRRANGFECELWSKEEVLERSKIRSAGALWTKDAGCVDPLRLTRALLKRARDGGARVYGRTGLTAIAVDRGRVQGTTAAGATVDAGCVVLATGYEMPCGFDPPTVRVHSTYAVVTEPDPNAAVFERFIVWESARPYFYVRATDDGRIVIGGADVPFRAPQTRDTLLPRKARRLERRLADLLGVEAIPVAFAWSGTFAETTDGLPLIGRHPQLANVFLALAYGGNGITFSALAAEMLAQMVRGEPSENAAFVLFAPHRHG